jgi:hypothetical protein
MNIECTGVCVHNPGRAKPSLQQKYFVRGGVDQCL